MLSRLRYGHWNHLLSCQQPRWPNTSGWPPSMNTGFRHTKVLCNSIIYPTISKTSNAFKQNLHLSLWPSNSKHLLLAFRGDLGGPVGISRPVQSHLALLVLLYIRPVNSIVEDLASFLHESEFVSDQDAVLTSTRCKLQ